MSRPAARQSRFARREAGIVPDNAETTETPKKKAAKKTAAKKKEES